MKNIKIDKSMIVYILIGVLILSQIIILIFCKKDNKPKPVNIVPTTTAPIIKEEPYQITYEMYYEPGETHYITINKDNIYIKTHYACSAINCEGTTTENTINHSSEEIEKITNILTKEFDFENKKLTINNESNTNKQNDILKAIMQESSEILNYSLEEYNYRLDFDNGLITYTIMITPSSELLIKSKEYTSEYSIKEITNYQVNNDENIQNQLKDLVLEIINKENENKEKQETYYYLSNFDNQKITKELNELILKLTKN